MSTIAFVVIGYLLGAIPTALIVSKSKNIDIRKHGSGNIGGTNTFRVLGKKAGIFVSLFDILKGLIAVLLPLLLSTDLAAALAGVAASVGHSYSIFAGFRGGKSVATSGGVMLALSPVSVLVGLITFTAVLFLTKYVSLSSILAALSVGVYVLITEDSLPIIYVTMFFVGFIIIRHHSNIKRLLQGVENKAFQKK